MDLATWAFIAADPDYYEPLDRAQDPTEQFHPATVPSGWVGVRSDVWLVWGRPDIVLPEQGWKIHASATLERSQHVLDLVAATCFTNEVSFKHLVSMRAYLHVHHKHGARPQAGKFCAIYPPDQAAAKRLLDELTERLRGEEGPYILSDRRYRDSRTVHYRYGAFWSRSRTRPDGSKQHLLLNRSGALVEDRRTVGFVLPDGITDPFAEPSPATPDCTDDGAAGKGIRVGRYRVLSALVHSNAGGAYRGVDPSGRPVFIKEARAHNGLYWDFTTAQQRLAREYRTLRDLHDLSPGLAPEPLDYFSEWEHEFMVTELIPGMTLYGYMAKQSPFAASRTATEAAAYFDLCRRYLEQLASALDRLHTLGYRFGDVNPWNMLVTSDGGLRLIDFEACGRLDQPPITMGAPGFLPPRLESEGVLADEYGLSAVALTLILPLSQVAARNPAILDHLYADASACAAIPTDIWQLATRNATVSRARRGGADARPGHDQDSPVTDQADGCLPGPEEVAADPLTHLNRLREALGAELAATAAPDDPYRMYPTVPQGYHTNTLCVAYGAAGVVHALLHAGMTVDQRVVTRLSREALKHRRELPPGLYTGAAGIGWVLAELGHLDEASALVAAAASHPSIRECCTWGEGTAGIGAANLALYLHTGDTSCLDRAAEIGDGLCGAGDLTPLVGPRNAIGLWHGRAGAALFLYHLWRSTGDRRYLHHGTTLLLAELSRAIEMPGGELGFPDNEVSQRSMVYLSAGSAGIGHVLTRYVHAEADDRLVAPTPQVFAYADRRLTVEPGLFQGLAGLCFALADHADLGGGGDPRFRRSAIEVATALFKYAVPAPAGRIRLLGGYSMRFSAELWSGTAGVLLALDRILNGQNGQLFTLDSVVLGGTGTALVGGRTLAGGRPSPSGKRMEVTSQ